jgi:hypothetical protein
MSAITRVLGLGAVLGVAWVAMPAQAGDKIKDVTCEQFLAMDEEERDDIVYWIHGVEVGSSKKAVAAADIEVGYDVFGRPVAEVVTACEADKKASLWEKIKAHF